ncbi:MAG: tRNA (cytidine(34)-2'-O)-methyltransferase [Kiritimatiellae bacterium]|nr:tRNA (cytidine(34)-2'-O)-methyltransferase [Kiritimatiellia bacterium]
MDIHIVLVEPEIPQNTGAVGRICVALQARLHLVRPLGFSLTDRFLKRSGLDYWKYLDLRIHDSWDCFVQTEAPEQMLFTSARAGRSIYEFNFRPDVYLVFGGESHGLPDRLRREYPESFYAVPMPGRHARSLNLANTVAVVAYEAWRQMNVLELSEANTKTTSHPERHHLRTADVCPAGESGNERRESQR